MAAGRVNDLRAFKGFIEEKLSSGGADLTPDEALADREIENQAEQEREETLAAVRQGFEDIDAGRLRPAREAIEELRRKHKLPPSS